MEFPAQHRYSIAFPMICSHFMNATHDLCPEEVLSLWMYLYVSTLCPPKIPPSISKLCTVSILQREYLSIFNKIASFSENLSYRHWKFLHIMYQYVLNSVVKISMMFTKYFEYFTIILGERGVFCGHTVYVLCVCICPFLCLVFIVCCGSCWCRLKMTLSVTMLVMTYFTATENKMPKTFGKLGSWPSLHSSSGQVGAACPFMLVTF